MTDVMPNFRVEAARLREQILAQDHNIARQKLEILEMADRLARNENNILAAEKAKADLQAKLAELEKTHGRLDDAYVEAAKKSIRSA